MATTSPARRWIIVAAITVLVTGAGLGSQLWQRPDATPEASLPETSPPAATAATPAPEAPQQQAAATPEPAAPETPSSDPAAESPAPPDPAAPEPAAPDTAATEAPGFDLVRMEPDGSAVVAGRAAPGSTVTIYSGDTPVAEAEADASGEFVALFETEPGAGAQSLTLEAKLSDGTRLASADVVVLLPATPAAQAPQEAAPAPPPAAQDTDLAAAPAPTPPPAAATAILREGRVEVTFDAADGEGPGLLLASIAYSDAGAVRLDGRAKPGSTVRAYVDDRFALDAAPDADGRWTLELPDLEAGLYTLRIDAVRPDGSISARVETPFQRERPSAPIPVSASGERPVAVIVQPGNSLWALARIHYGAGVRYTQIYTANKDLIRDPALIYPGQIFALPPDQDPAAN